MMPKEIYGSNGEKIKPQLLRKFDNFVDFIAAILKFVCRAIIFK